MLGMTLKGDFSPGFKGNLRCQRVPQGSRAPYGAVGAVQHCSFCCASALTMEELALGTESTAFTFRPWHFS